MKGGSVSVIDLHKSYGEVPAVRGINLDIAAGEFFSLLGPSGCGKTTTLRMIAGFETPTSGEIRIDGSDVSKISANDRPVNTVFQNYALFPFMSVEDNVAFGLRYQKVGKADAKRKVGEALDMVRMGQYAKRRPGQLSGGQQQRVALARAIVLGPRVLLLDEPLGALDAKLRKTLQIELKSLQESLGITFIYVTHDQEEALTMSDRIAVFDAGRIAQVGTPVEIYEHPKTPFVAGFVGVSNLLAAGAAATILGREGTWSVRPEKIRVMLGSPAAEAHERAAAGVIHEVVYVGMATRFIVDLDAGGTLIAVQQNTHATSDELNSMRGQRVTLMWNTEHEVPVGP